MTIATIDGLTLNYLARGNGGTPALAQPGGSLLRDFGCVGAEGAHGGRRDGIKVNGTSHLNFAARAAI